MEVRREAGGWEPWGGEDLSPVRLRVQLSGRMCLDMHRALASVPSTKKQKRREHSLIKFLGVLNLVTLSVLSMTMMTINFYKQQN